MLELRNKAAKMADAGTTKMANTRDRMTSQPSKNINWNAEIKSKPPPPPKPPAPLPPPTRISSANNTSMSQGQENSPAPPVPLRRLGSSASPSLSRSTSQVSQISSSSCPPPVIRRDTRPDAVASLPRVAVSKPEPAHIDKIDWANLSPEDKQEFFSWLDEFFARYLHAPVPARAGMDAVQHVKVALNGRTAPPDVAPGPPKVPTSSRPKTPPRPVFNGPPAHASSQFSMSYPPPNEHGSAGADLAYYFSPSTYWPDAWYTDESDMSPPPLRGSQHTLRCAAWKSDGRMKTLYGGVLFSDLSMCWWSVYWPQNGSHDPNDTRTVQRSARYLPRPESWTREQLVDAHETYGETIAAYAESYEGTNQPCARGECWDLADQGIKYFEQYDYVPKPVPSISRTHGHLIYEGKASNKGSTQAGRWRGGDDRVRRGDIVEWREARVARGPYSWATLGNPEHTAVIVSDMIPSTSVADGMAVRPAEMGTLEVIEQSKGSPPKRATHDLSQFEEGEVWIYRPVGLEVYVGCLLTPECPDGVNALSI